MSPPVVDIHFTWPDGSRRLTLIRSCTSKQQGDRDRRARGLFQARWFRLHTRCTRRGRRRAGPRRNSPCSLVRVLCCAAGPLIIIHMKAEPWRRRDGQQRQHRDGPTSRARITKRLGWSLARGCARGPSVGLLRLSLTALSLLAERSGDGITCVALKGLLTPCTTGLHVEPEREREIEK